MRRIAGIGLLVLVVLASGCGVPGQSAPATPPPPTVSGFTVGLVTDVGGLHDHSYNQLAYLGLKRAQTKERARVVVLSSATERDYIPNLTQLALERVSLIVAVGFSMANAVYDVATAYPAEHFALVDATPVDDSNQQQSLPNVANLYFNEQQAGYLVGVVAGLMERNHVGKAVHNTIGYLGGEDIVPVDRYLAGYVAGARAVDPSVRIIGAFAQTFTSAALGRRLGASQVHQGADILFQVAAQTGTGYLAAAQANHVYGIGADSDQHYLGSAVITSAVKKVDVAVADIAGDEKKGTFRGGDHQYGLQQGGVGFAPPSAAVPTYIIRTARSYAAQIVAGRITPPTVLNS